MINLRWTWLFCCTILVKLLWHTQSQIFTFFWALPTLKHQLEPRHLYMQRIHQVYLLPFSTFFIKCIIKPVNVDDSSKEDNLSVRRHSISGQIVKEHNISDTSLEVGSLTMQVLKLK